MTGASIHTRWLVAGAVAFAGLATIGLDLATRPRPRTMPAPDLTPGFQISPGHAIVRPPAVAAAVARLADNEPVIGVKIRGKARAYRRKALERILDHVVNDVLGTAPVSVTYCDRTHCVRVYTGDGTEPLELMVGAYRDGLLLKVRGRLFRQDTGAPADAPAGQAIPYRTLPFEETTWGAWRAEHPDTDVYLGRPDSGDRPASAGG